MKQVSQEESPVLVPQAIFGQLIQRQAGGESNRLVQGLALAHGGSEVDAAQEYRLGGPLAGDEHGFQVAPEAWGQAHQALRQREQRVHLIQTPRALRTAARLIGRSKELLRVTEPPGRGGLAEQRQPATPQALRNAAEVLLDQVRTEGRVQWIRI